MFALERNGPNSQKPPMRAAYRTAFLKHRTLVSGARPMFRIDLRDLPGGSPHQAANRMIRIERDTLQIRGPAVPVMSLGP